MRDSDESHIYWKSHRCHGRKFGERSVDKFISLTVNQGHLANRYKKGVPFEHK